MDFETFGRKLGVQLSYLPSYRSSFSNNIESDLKPTVVKTTQVQALQRPGGAVLDFEAQLQSAGKSDEQDMGRFSGLQLQQVRNNSYGCPFVLRARQTSSS